MLDMQKTIDLIKSSVYVYIVREAGTTECFANVTLMTQLSPDTQEMLDSLRAAVAETLERKRRLGHYAVFWQGGKPVLVGDDAPDQPCHRPVDDQKSN